MIQINFERITYE